MCECRDSAPNRIRPSIGSIILRSAKASVLYEMISVADSAQNFSDLTEYLARARPTDLKKREFSDCKTTTLTNVSHHANLFARLDLK